jgi:hypothetical protein
MPRRLAVVLALAALPLAATACGGGKKAASTTTVSAASAKQAVRAAAEKTAKAGSVKLVLSAGTTAAGTPVVVHGGGAFDTSAHKGKLHLSFTAAGIASTANVVLDGTTLYLHSPLFQFGLPAGKKWIKVDLQKGAKAAGVDLSKLLAQDPTQTLDELKGVTTVTEIGPTQVGGLSVTRYRAHVTANAAGTAAAGIYDVWVGSDGYVHRVRTVVAATSGTKVTATSTLSGFGDPVTVNLPPEASTYTSTTGTLPVPAG